VVEKDRSNFCDFFVFRDTKIAGNGKDFLESVKIKAESFFKENEADILVLDMIMEPGIDGLETWRRILEINPQQKAIVGRMVVSPRKSCS
jgi:CheY-like chemotaxis protein